MINQLITLGLSEKEARVYVALLELGPSTMLEVAAKAEINRPTSYFQIESLKKRGLVSTLKKGKRVLFSAEDPEQLHILLNQEKQTLEQKKETLSSLLPDLESLFRFMGEKPEVRFFEGREGLLRMQEEFLKNKNTTILGISSIDDVLRVFPRHSEEYVSQRVARKISSRLLYTSSRGHFLKTDKTILRESRYLPPEKLPITTDVTIYGDSVAITALKGKIIGTIITHKEIAYSFRGLFEFLWSAAKEI